MLNKEPLLSFVSQYFALKELKQTASQCYIKPYPLISYRHLFFFLLFTTLKLTSFWFVIQIAASLVVLAAVLSALGQDWLDIHKLPAAIQRDQNWIDVVCWSAETQLDLYHYRDRGLRNLLYLNPHSCSRPSHIPPASSSTALQSDSAGANMTDQRRTKSELVFKILKWLHTFILKILTSDNINT